MDSTAPYIDALAHALADSRSRERMILFLPLVRLLANGTPVAPAQLAAALGWPVTQVTEALRQCEEIVFDEQGRIVGAGLSLVPTPHRFTVQGRTLYAWCALDTLLFPIWLGCEARISSSCPATGIPVHLIVTPQGIVQLDPASAVLSVRMPPGLASYCNIREAFCVHSLFFANRQAAATWQASHPDGQVLSLEEAFLLGQQLARLRRQRLQEGKL
jgi:alkylmercury lyase